MDRSDEIVNLLMRKDKRIRELEAENKQLKEALIKLRDILIEIDPEFNLPYINDLLK